MSINVNGLDNYIPHDRIVDIRNNNPCIEIATAYYHINGRRSDTDPSNMIALASIAMVDDDSFHALENYIATECRRVYPAPTFRHRSDDDTLFAFGIKIHKYTVSRSTYIDQGFPLTGITLHRNIHDYIRKIRFSVKIMFDNYLGTQIGRIDTLTLIQPSDTLYYDDTYYLYFSTTGNSNTRFLEFYCTCDLTDIEPENYPGAVRDAINARLHDKIVPYLEKVINKLSLRI